MPRAKKPTIATEQVRGMKYLDRVLPLLQRLHDDATARDRAGNRTLFYDQYAALVLLAMFSPALDSLRAIQQASATRKVKQLLGCSRASLGSLSEAARVFDPTLLEQVIAELGQELAPLAKDPRLTADVRNTLVLVDAARCCGRWRGWSSRGGSTAAPATPCTAGGCTRCSSWTATCRRGWS
jgi:hypothetical protein